MTKLENNINNLCVENMGIYGCKHAVKEHVWTGKAHMIAKLKKNVKSMREEPFAYACMFFSVDTLVSCIKEILWENREDVEKIYPKQKDCSGIRAGLHFFSAYCRRNRNGNGLEPNASGFLCKTCNMQG